MIYSNFLLNPLNKIISSLLKLKRFEKRLIIIFLDIIIVSFSIWASVSIRLGNIYVPLDTEIFIFLIPIVIGPIIFWQAQFYKVIIRYIYKKHIFQILKGTFILTIGWVFFVKYIFPNYFNIEIAFLPRSVPFIFFILVNSLLILSRFAGRYVLNISNFKNFELNKVVIYGTGISGKDTYYSLINNEKIKVIGFLDPNKDLHNQSVYGYKVIGDYNLINKIKSQYKNFTVLLIDLEITQKQRLNLTNECQKYDIPVRVIPDISGLINGMALLNLIQDVTPDQILDRSEIKTKSNFSLKSNYLKSILVTGAGGSIGKELCRQLIDLKPSHLILLDNSEYNLYLIKQELEKTFEQKQSQVQIIYTLGSIENIEFLEKLIEKYNINSIFHAAAYKHVNLVEVNPLTAIKNNIFGTLNLINLAIKFKILNFILISTDKAVRPSTLMGKTKRISELIVQAGFSKVNEDNTANQVFSIVRFGNVLESSGSVIPIFKKQISNGGPVTVTHKDVTRYFMTIPEASRLVIQASEMALGGEVFVLDMGAPVKIDEIAKKLIRLSGFKVYEENGDLSRSIKIKYIGLSAGEKLHEELIIGNKVKKTKVSKILKAEEVFTDWRILESNLIKLESLIMKNDENSALKLLNQMLRKQ